MKRDIEKSVRTAIKKAKQGLLEFSELLSLSDRLVEEGQSDQSIMLYRLWIDNTKSSAALFVAYYNLGALLCTAGDDSAAELVYRQAIAMKSDFIHARLNLGSVLERLGRQEEALDQWRQVLNFPIPDDKSLYIHALNNLGRLLEIRYQFSEAEEMLERSLLLDPAQSPVVQHWVHLRQKQCKWPVYSELCGLTVADITNQTSAIAMLGLSDDPALQLAAARHFVEDKVNSQVVALCNPNGYGHKKLRIGYLSSNFNIHAVSLLTVELYELHDRDRVEVYAFCWSGEDITSYRNRIAMAVDKYIRIADMSDEDAAKCIRSHEIDILVDLQGLTSGARPNILSARPAPIQVSYLGFPGTTGLPCNDYVIADKFVLPEELTPYFSEKPLYMPNSFQVSDRGRVIGQRPTRASCGLPDDAFVFCSFNNNYKFTPEVFSTWMRILKLTPKSVLWLLADNEWSRENLCKAAERHGINRERLIFASRVAPPDYLARYQIADLFLDTYPFNAGTTANDALWMGLPILTCAGRTFASRMAGSLLTTLGLSELVTYNMDEYEKQAVSLAKNTKRVSELKQYLIGSRSTSPLFDIPQFVRDLEGLYEGVASSLYAGHNQESAIASSGMHERSVDSNIAKKNVLIEGWSGINHSFAMVNQYQLLELMDRDDFRLFHRELPYPSPAWSQEKNDAGFDSASAQLIRRLPAPSGQDFDCVYTIGWPFRRTDVKSKKVITFMVTELGLDNDSFMEKGNEISELVAGKNIIVTPSAWSKEKIVGFGIESQKVMVVPHGVDSKIFYPPSIMERENIRSQLGVLPGDFVFLNVSGMHWNKGVDLLVVAFSYIRKIHSNARLVLKDNRKLYGVTAESVVHDVMRRYPELVDETVRQSIILLTSDFSLDQLRLLYGSVDSYVSPYRAEGFNLPVIEAIASGTKVIVTKGGATDDFCDTDTALMIESSIVENQAVSIAKYGYHLEPKIDNLVEQMERALMDRGASAESFAAGRERLIKEFSWASCTNKLASLMIDESQIQTIYEAPVNTGSALKGKTFFIYCDGGFANRFNSLVSGLAISRLLNVEPEIIWPVNSWCGARFEALFDSYLPVVATELVELKNNNDLDGFIVVTHEDQSTFLNVPYISPYGFDSVESFASFVSQAALGVFYYPALIPDWIPKNAIETAVRDLSFKQSLMKTVDDFIVEHLQKGFYGIHLRRTDLVLGFTNDEVKDIAAQHTDKLFFVCSDSEETEHFLMSVPNIRIKKKNAYVEMKVDSGNWNSPTLDDSGRAYYSNVTRSEQSVLDAVVDLLILSRSKIIGPRGSTFFGVAKLLQTVFPNSASDGLEDIVSPNISKLPSNEPWVNVYQPDNVISNSDYGLIIINLNDTVIGRSIRKDGYWGSQDIELIESILGQTCKGQEDQDICLLDVGSNIGTHTLAFAKFKIPGLTVHAFEAQRQVFYMLAGTVALNNLTNVYCHNVAVSSESGQDLKIPKIDYSLEGNFGGIEIMPPVRSDNDPNILIRNQYETVKTVKLDDLKLKNVKLIKMDIEGMEDRAIQGALETIKEQRPVLFVEIHKTNFPSIMEIFQTLNYCVFVTPLYDAIFIPMEHQMAINGATRLM